MTIMTHFTQEMTAVTADTVVAAIYPAVTIKYKTFAAKDWERAHV